MQIKLFVTGTDTGVGKTFISVGLLKACNRLGLSTLGIKPIASDCFRHKGVLYNDDALSLQQASSVKLNYDCINPFSFEPPIAPHIAANQMQHKLDLKLLNQKSHYAMNHPVNVCIIEGVGGWYVPLNQTETMADFVVQNNLKTILVIGMRLGCLNHGILTFKAMQQDGVRIAGWIANCVDPNMAYVQENIATLQRWLSVPCLGVVQNNARPEECLNIENDFNFSSQ